MPTYAVFALEDRSDDESRLAQNLASPATGGLGGRPNRWVLRRRLPLGPFVQWSRTIGWWSTEPACSLPRRRRQSSPERRPITRKGKAGREKRDPLDCSPQFHPPHSSRKGLLSIQSGDGVRAEPDLLRFRDSYG
jgi:hypothetical protein